MSALDFPPADSIAPAVEDLVEVGAYATAAQAAEHGLVVLAAGYPYWLAESGEGFRVFTERAAAPTARAHLLAYERESTHWPPPPITDPWTPRKMDLITPLLWAVTVLVVFRIEATAPWLTDRGALDPHAIFEGGEWWRLATALFLHADAGHVLSNVLGGLLVFSAVLATVGSRRGWLLILLASITGNLAVAAINYPAPYRSVGASTAIFAAVGLLTGRAIRVGWRSTHPHRWCAMFAPFAAGATVLALYGAGGQRIDVGAHFTGFLAGVVFGFAVGTGIGRQRNLNSAV